MNILMLAGCDHVYSFTEMLGRSLARRVYGTRAQSNIIARFGTLCLAEAPVIHTEFMGQTLRECRFRERFGLNVAGLWEGNSYMSARPDSRIDEASILLLAGTADQLEAYDRKAERSSKANRTPVLILGRAARWGKRRRMPWNVAGCRSVSSRRTPGSCRRTIPVTFSEMPGNWRCSSGAHHGNPIRHRDHA